MTQLLDQMIQDKVESGHVLPGERGILRVRHDTVTDGEFAEIAAVTALARASLTAGAIVEENAETNSTYEKTKTETKESL